MKTQEKKIAILILMIMLCVILLTVAIIEDGYGAVDYFVGHSADISNEQLDFITKYNATITDNPSITVLTHGINGGANTWSNEGKEILTYDNDSLIEKLRLKNPNSYVYVAKFIEDEVFKLNKLNISEQSVYEEVTVNELTLEDIGKHSIIIFDAKDNLASLNELYQSLNFLIDKIHYEYLSFGISDATINLIGNGIGGIINTMYANEHPFNVSSIYNIGTPFKGSVIGDIEHLQNTIGSFLLFKDYYSAVSMAEIQDTNYQTNLKNAWNIAVERNPNIKAHAIASGTSTGMLREVFNIIEAIIKFNNDIIGFKGTTCDLLQLINENAKYVIAILPEFIKLKPFLEYLETGDASNISYRDIEYIANYVGMPDLAKTFFTIIKNNNLNSVKTLINANVDIKPIIRTIEGYNIGSYAKILDFKFLADFLDNIPWLALPTSELISASLAVWNFFSSEPNFSDYYKLLQEIDGNYGKWIDKELVVIADDFMVGAKSQTPDDYDNMKAYYKLFQADDLYCGKLSDNEMKLPIPHNLAPRNLSIINYIVDDIEMMQSGNELFVARFINKETAEIIKYKGESNESITVPSTLYGKTIVGIANNAFTNCNIQKIILPDSLKYIGDSAFNGATITTISLPSSLEKIGSMAFANCGNLNSIILPKSLKTIGEGAFANCNNIQFTIDARNMNYYIENNSLYTFNGSILIHYGFNVENNFNLPSCVTTISNFAFSNNKTLKSINLNNVIEIQNNAFADTYIENFYGGELLENIGLNAFDNSSWLINGDDMKYIGSILVKYVGVANTLTESDFPSEIKYIADGAFMNNNTLRSISFNREIKVIGNSSFYGCQNLEKVYLNREIREIRSKAFSNCKSLISIDMDSVYEPYISDDAFVFSNHLLKFYVPNLYLENYVNMIALNKFNYNNKITSHEIEITYDANGGMISGENPNQCKFYSIIDGLYAAHKKGYRFIGWFDENNEKYENGGIWKNKHNMKLYAKWEAEIYTIHYNFYGGTTIDSISDYYYITDDINLPNASKRGYDFIGWYDNKDFIGEKIYQITKGSTGNKEFYAKFIAKEYSIELNSSELGVEEDTLFIVNYDTSFKLPIPQKVGHDFIGWKDENNVFFTNSTGDGMFLWNQLNNCLLIPHFETKYYIFKIIDEENVYWWNEDGLQQEKVSIKFGSSVSLYGYFYNFYKSQINTVPGKIFRSLQSNNSSNFGRWNSVPDLGDSGSVITVYPIWQLEQHKLIIYKDSTIIQQVNAVYDEELCIKIPEKEGYKFAGWEIIACNANVENTNLAIGNKFNYLRMPDLSPKEQSNASMIIKATFESSTSTLIFDSQGGSDCPNLHGITYGSILGNLPISNKKGYQFLGWYDSNNVQYGNESIWDKNINGSVVLTAKWQLITYSITYNLNGGSAKGNITNYTVETPTFTLNRPIKIGFRFIGWEFKGDFISEIILGSAENIVLNAIWSGTELYTSQIYNNTINDMIVLVDFTNYNQKNTYVINSNVEEITIKGTAFLQKTSFIIANRNSTLTIRLWDVNFESHNNTDFINYTGNQKIIIEFLGSNRIVGGLNSNSKEHATATVNAKNSIVEIIGNSPSDTLLIIGGVGESGISNIGDSGKYGGIGVVATELHLKKGNIAIVGGKGGYGGSGRNGINGICYDDFDSSGYGINGGNGTDGSIGGKGGDGNYAVNIKNKILILDTANAVLQGGQGGKGGNGGYGSDGRDASLFVYSRPGGNGGDGGNGGNGGAAGLGAAPTNTTVIVGNVKMLNGNLGTVGHGGNGGRGGAAGKGGKLLNGTYQANGKQGNEGNSGY